MATTPTIPLADCHAHLDDFGRIEMPGVVARAQRVGVRLLITAGVTLHSSRACIALAEEYDLVYAGVGIHPSDLTGPVDDITYAALRDLARHPKVLVISETGLDYLPGTQPKQVQDQAFRAQVRLARELRLPVVFHSREAHEDALRVLREEGAGQAGAIMHYFQGDEATADDALTSGFYLSLAKPLLRLPHLQALAKRLPMDRVVLETDAFPQPWKLNRSAWTEPAHVRQVAEKLAELRDMPVEEVCRLTTANLVRLLGPRAPQLIASVTSPA